jgi:hypothetical protein
MAVVVAGCVVSDPPEYGLVKQTPPFVDLSGASPAVFTVTSKSPGEVVSPSVDFRSEDAGDDVVALLYLNWSIAGKEDFQDINLLPASTFDQPRKASGISWPVEQKDVGCQQLSLILVHRSGYNTLQKKPATGAQYAIVTWWFNITDPQNPQDVLLTECPSNVGGT